MGGGGLHEVADKWKTVIVGIFLWCKRNKPLRDTLVLEKKAHCFL